MNKSFVVNPKFELGCMIAYESIQGVIKQGKIVGYRVYKSVAYRPECYSLTYIVEPEEYIGFEHDEEIDIPECHKVCLPRILHKL